MNSRNKKRAFAVAMVIMILVGGTAVLPFVIGALTPKTQPDYEGYAIMLLKGYEDRNAAAITFFERTRKDPATAEELKRHADQARALGQSIRKNLLIANPSESARAELEQYMTVQCTIARKAESAMSRDAVWTKASFWRDSYNKAAARQMSYFEQLFGSKRLLVRECG